MIDNGIFPSLLFYILKKRCLFSSKNKVFGIKSPSFLEAVLKTTFWFVLFQFKKSWCFYFQKLSFYSKMYSVPVHFKIALAILIPKTLFLESKAKLFLNWNELKAIGSKKAMLFLNWNERVLTITSLFWELKRIKKAKTAIN